MQKLILTDLPVDGTDLPVIMQACKNGFFYVLDRRTGKLLSAKNFSYVNWASHIDMKTGRPVVTKQADWYSSPRNVYPSWAGAHTWNPMSYSAQTHLVYIPVIDLSAIWVDMQTSGGRMKYLDGFFTVQGIYPDDTYDAAALRGLYGPLPDLHALKATRKVALVRELLRAWDPQAQKIVWEHETSSGIRGLRRRRDVDGREPGVSRTRQRRAVGVCGRHGQGAEGDQDGQPHHGGSFDLFRQRRTIRRGTGRVRRNRHHRGAHTAQQRGPQVPKHQPHHCLQAGRRHGADSAAAAGRTVPETAGRDRRQGPDRCG